MCGYCTTSLKNGGSKKKNSHFVLLQECDYHCVAGDMISATQPPHRMAKNAQNMRVNSSCPSLSSVLS